MALTNLTSDQTYEYTSQSNIRVSPLASPQTGLYYEMLYRNFTGEELELLYDNGEVQEIPPITDAYNRYNRRCIIQRRGCVGPQMNPESAIGDQMKSEMTLRTWTVQALQLNRGPVYIDELNVVICYKHHLQDAVHPYRRMNVQDTQQLFLQHLQEVKSDKTSCYFLVNDPLKRFTHLYCDIAGVSVVLNVTDLIDSEHKEATLTIIIENGESITRRDYNIEGVLKDSYMIIQNCPIGVVGLSEEIVSMHRFEKMYTQKDLDQEVARAKALEERKYQQQVNTLTVEKKEVETKLAKTQQELAVLQNQYNSVTGNIKGQQELTANAAAYAKSSSTISEANMKKYTIIMGIITAVSTVVTLVVSFFKGFFDIFSGGSSTSKRFC